MDCFEQIDFLSNQNISCYSEKNKIDENDCIIEKNNDTCDNILYEYEYEKYDIIDFLELEYLDYLDTIPQKIWTKFKKDIENVFYKISNEKVIDYVMNKIQPFDISTYVIKNFKKISLEILKKCFEVNFIKIYNKINKDYYQKKNIFTECISEHGLEFNEYFYKVISEYENKNQIKNTNENTTKKVSSSFDFISNFFVKLTGDKNSKGNEIESIGVVNSELKKIFEEVYSKKDISSSILPYSFEVLKYYTKLFRLEDNFRSFNIYKKKNMFESLYNMEINQINNYEKMLELKNFLGITDKELIQNIIFPDKKQFAYVLPIIYKICQSGNIDYVLAVVNNYNIPNTLYYESTILNMIIYSGISKNVNLVIIIYNLFLNKFPHIFTKDFYGKIIYQLIDRTKPNYHEYDNIIYEFINLGGIVKGYGVYTEYIECLTFKNNSEPQKVN